MGLLTGPVELWTFKETGTKRAHLCLLQRLVDWGWLELCVPPPDLTSHVFLGSPDAQKRKCF